MPWVPWILSAASLLVAFVGLLRTFSKDKADHYAHLSGDIVAHQGRLDLIEMKLAVFWKLVEEHLSTLLKRPTHLEMDALLDKLKDHTLTLDGARMLRVWLKKVYLDEEAVHAQQRVIAILVLAAVDSLVQELEKDHA